MNLWLIKEGFHTYLHSENKAALLYGILINQRAHPVETPPFYQ